MGRLAGIERTADRDHGQAACGRRPKFDYHPGKKCHRGIFSLRQVRSKLLAAEKIAIYVAILGIAACEPRSPVNTSRLLGIANYHLTACRVFVPLQDVKSAGRFFRADPPIQRGTRTVADRNRRRPVSVTARASATRRRVAARALHRHGLVIPLAGVSRRPADDGRAPPGGDLPGSADRSRGGSATHGRRDSGSRIQRT